MMGVSEGLGGGGGRPKWEENVIEKWRRDGVGRWEGERKLIYEGEMENGKSKAERGELRHLFLDYSHLLANPDATKKTLGLPDVKNAVLSI
jgi:hypothetical protein